MKCIQLHCERCHLLHSIRSFTAALASSMITKTWNGEFCWNGTALFVNIPLTPSLLICYLPSYCYFLLPYSLNEFFCFVDKITFLNLIYNTVGLFYCIFSHKAVNFSLLNQLHEGEILLDFVRNKKFNISPYNNMSPIPEDCLGYLGNVLVLATQLSTYWRNKKSFCSLSLLELWIGEPD